MSKTNVFLLSVVLVVVFVLANTFYIVNQAEQAIVLQFGEPVRLVKEPGLKIKTPFIQNVILKNAWMLTALRVIALSTP